MVKVMNTALFSEGKQKHTTAELGKDYGKKSCSLFCYDTIQLFVHDSTKLLKIQNIEMSILHSF